MIRNGATTITDGAITLREITREDSKFAYGLRFLHEPTRMMFKTSNVIPFERHQQVIDDYFSEGNNDRWFIIEEDDAAIGMLALVGMSGSEAECGRIIIAPHRRRSGLGLRSLLLLMDYCRGAGLRRVRAEVFEDNAASLRMFEKAGFLSTTLSPLAGRGQGEGRKLIHLQKNLA